ncbi:hypothetical protein HPB50_004816 [Hyalomma asiaticum]|uniref:Uncharacterized protein n=1 Tax=Hyalomma asiaticum TaxID=266040 RepID=A0ACB7SMG3_HYAAI|nr:hypothetical protein HPB50_004816 [Hyalomma asiaticum]
MAPEIDQHQPRPTSVPGHGENEGCQVSQFYNDREVLITGGTGFVGKVLLEKLLRSCSGLKRVYLLVRNKKGQRPQARLEEMFGSQVFDRLKKEQPGAFAKVTAVAGDLVQPGLGLGASDRATLVHNVSVVFHSGAVIKFNETFRKAYEVNVLGTKRVMELCRQMPGIHALVHVSTAYCNCDKLDVHEVIYPPCEDLQEFMEYCESAAECVQDTTEGGLFGHPNTYTLSKIMAEYLLLEKRENVPVSIVRPSTIAASLREPLPGWVDNYNGITGITVALGLGLLPSLLAKKEDLVDIVPVDIVANTLICAAWRTATTRQTYVKAYHCTSGTLKQQTWSELVDSMQTAIVKYPLPDAVCYPKFTVTRSQLWYDINLYCKRFVPAQAADLALQLMRREPRFVRHYTKTFNIDMRSVDWYPYWDQCLLGIRKHLFKAEVSELSKARKRLTWLYARRLSLKVFLIGLVCPLLATQTAWDIGSMATLLGLQFTEPLCAIADLPPKL